MTPRPVWIDARDAEAVRCGVSPRYFATVCGVRLRVAELGYGWSWRCTRGHVEASTTRMYSSAGGARRAAEAMARRIGR